MDLMEWKIQLVDYVGREIRDVLKIKEVNHTLSKKVIEKAMQTSSFDEFSQAVSGYGKFEPNFLSLLRGKIIQRVTTGDAVQGMYNLNSRVTAPTPIGDFLTSTQTIQPSQSTKGGLLIPKKNTSKVVTPEEKESKFGLEELAKQKRKLKEQEEASGHIENKKNKKPKVNQSSSSLSDKWADMLKEDEELENVDSVYSFGNKKIKQKMCIMILKNQSTRLWTS